MTARWPDGVCVLLFTTFGGYGGYGGNGEWERGFALMMLTIINFFILIYKQSNNVYGRFIIRYS